LGKRLDLACQFFDRVDRIVVAATLRVDDQDEPLAPVVEDDGSVDQQEPDRREGRLLSLWRRVTVEETSCLVARVPHESPGDGGEAFEPGSFQLVDGSAERLARREPT